MSAMRLGSFWGRDREVPARGVGSFCERGRGLSARGVASFSCGSQHLVDACVGAAAGVERRAAAVWVERGWDWILCVCIETWEKRTVGVDCLGRRGMGMCPVCAWKRGQSALWVWIVWVDGEWEWVLKVHGS